MIERLRTLPSHRRMVLLIRFLNTVLVLALLAFALRRWIGV